MFQTEPILFLQSRGGAALDAAMVFVSWFGYPAFYIVALCVVLFAFDFRRGFALLQLLLWTAALTELLKNTFGLPRPYDADSRVLDVGRGRIPRTDLIAMGGRGFFDLPQPEALEHVRALDGPSFGLPSGHTGGCVAFAGGLALVWRSRRGALAALAAVVTMAFSRMYLGKHFPADVGGGLVLGSAALLAAAWWWTRPDRLVVDRVPDAAGAAALVVPPFVLLALPVPTVAVGLFVGINVGFVAVSRAGIPPDGGPVGRRVARALLALTTILGTGFAMRALPDVVGLAFAQGFVPGLALVWGTTTLARRLGLYPAG